MDVEKQVDYWRSGGEEDIAAAESLVSKGYLRHGLFFAHLAVEKILKAHVARTTGEIPHAFTTSPGWPSWRSLH